MSSFQLDVVPTKHLIARNFRYFPERFRNGSNAGNAGRSDLLLLSYRQVPACSRGLGQTWVSPCQGFRERLFAVT